MRLSRRSYPHPVVGNGDDVPGVAFQVACDYSSDAQYYYIAISAACSSTTLQRMVKSGDACYSLHVECSNTLYRRVFEFSGERHRIKIPATSLHDSVEVSSFVRAKKHRRAYRVEGAHEDYGAASFEISQGDILAVGESHVFYAEPHDTLKRIGSIMVIEQSPDPGDHPMRPDLNADKIRILLCESDFEAYSRLKAIPSLTSHLTTTIVLPVLTHALQQIALDPATFQSCRWYQSLERRLAMLAIDEQLDPLIKAQVILELPIRRALAAAEAYAAGGEG